MINSLRAANLWLNSELILASKCITIRWLEPDNPSYTYFKDMETIIETVIAKVASGNPIVAAQFALVKVETFIRCIPNLFFETRAQKDSILIQTANNESKIALNLLGIISLVDILSHNVIPKDLKHILEEANYDTLITIKKIDLNQQRQITCVNEVEAFFETSINIDCTITDS